MSNPSDSQNIPSAPSSGRVDRIEMRSRADIPTAQRIIVKVGTSTVSREDGSVSLGRVGHLVEQLSELNRQGKEIILVSSGAVGIGRAKLLRQQLFSRSVASHMKFVAEEPRPPSTKACAAAGQSGLMGLYEQLFGQYGVQCAQVLVTPNDFGEKRMESQLKRTINWLLQHDTIPVLNENDAITAARPNMPSTGGTEVFSEARFKDNDGLAALLGTLLYADLVVLLSDVQGVYRRMPAPGEKPDVIDVLTRDTRVSIGDKSSAGRGGMAAKIEAAFRALESGVGSIVIASGHRPDTLHALFAGEKVGTLLIRQAAEGGIPPAEAAANGAAAAEGKPPAALAVDPANTNGEAKAAETNGGAKPEANGAAKADGPSPEARASAVRTASRQLQKLTGAERAAVLERMADALLENADAIYKANEVDVQAAKEANVDAAILGRLGLPPKKLQTVVDGVRALAKKDNPLGRVLGKTKIADGLDLVQETVAIGVLLIIFESRPDVLPQVSALALITGNGVLMKGGREALHTNRALHAIITGAVSDATQGRVPKDVVSLLESRTEVAGLLSMHKYIDLVIPRGGAALVQHVMQNSSIPVLGHADGICHAFVDKAADVAKAVRLISDAKTDYPTACNAVETVLFHKQCAEDGRAKAVIEGLQGAGITVLAGPNAQQLFGLPAAESMHVEYGNTTLCVEVVPDVDAAVEHIAEHGSSHTEFIITEDEEAARQFLSSVDSACVFHNASSRFADGFRFGLGCEVGISTSRIHARGPVGLEGLLTTRWQLRSTAEDGHTAQDFSSGRRAWVHEQVPITK